jgi:glycosyltransferase involved in cell wall biosynthesis
VLAIAAPSFGHISETFIADHVRHLVPGRIVLISQDGRGSAGYGCPVLSHLQPGFTAFGPLDAWAKDLRFRLRRRFGPALGFDDRMRLIAFLKEQQVTVVLAEFGAMGVLAADACEALGLPLHVYFYGVDASANLRYAAVRRRYRRLWPRVAGVICISRFLADRLVESTGLPERLIEVIPCGVDPARFTPAASEPGRVLALGRLVDKKAPHLTVRAFAAAAAAHPAAHLDLIGDGPLRPQVEAAVAETGMQARVTLHGALGREACAALMHRASVFVQHSVTAPNGDTEGLPIVVLEAMASALPVVSTRHSGIPEAVEDGATGILVAEGDVAGMGAALARLLADPALAARMGAAGHARFRAGFTQGATLARLRATLGLSVHDAAPPRLASAAHLDEESGAPGPARASNG